MDKAVGTYLEQEFRAYLKQSGYPFELVLHVGRPEIVGHVGMALTFRTPTPEPGQERHSM
mgnify:CR=1 FL=1